MVGFGMLRSIAVLLVLTSGYATAIAQAPAPPPNQEQTQSQEPFGEEVTLPGKPIVFIAGKATWDKAYPTLVANFKSIAGFLAKQKITPAGSMITIYTSVFDTGFAYQAGVPLAEAATKLPRGTVLAGQSPVGKAVKFVHRGSYESMEMLYEAINNYLDSKGLEKQGLFYEEYVTDPTTTPEDKLVVNVYVLLK
jgi:effector-binding domain-containing protein